VPCLFAAYPTDKPIHSANVLDTIRRQSIRVRRVVVVHVARGVHIPRIIRVATIRRS